MPSPSDRERRQPSEAEPADPPAVGEDDVFPPGAVSEEGIDLALLRSHLAMTPAERLAVLQEMLDFVALARRGRPS